MPDPPARMMPLYCDGVEFDLDSAVDMKKNISPVFLSSARYSRQPAHPTTRSTTRLLHQPSPTIVAPVTAWSAVANRMWSLTGNFTHCNLFVDLSQLIPNQLIFHFGRSIQIRDRPRNRGNYRHALFMAVWPLPKFTSGIYRVCNLKSTLHLAALFHVSVTSAIEPRNGATSR